MIQSKEVFSDGFYIFESKVSANSNYIENLNEAKQLLIYANFYLKSYLVIHDYVITRDGWQMAVEIKVSIENKSENKEDEVWKVISERIRLWLSTYVKRVNFWRKRKGVLVRDNYRRYYFETIEEALEHIDKIRNQQIKLYRGKKKYRGRKSHYKIEKINEKGSIFLCSRDMKEKKELLQKEIGSQLFGGFQNVVGRKAIISTSKRHVECNQSKFKYNSS